MKVLLFSFWVILTFMLFISVIFGFFIVIIDDKEYPGICWWDIGEKILSKKQPK